MSYGDSSYRSTIHLIRSCDQAANHCAICGEFGHLEEQCPWGERRLEFLDLRSTLREREADMWALFLAGIFFGWVLHWVWGMWAR